MSVGRYPFAAHLESERRFFGFVAAALALLVFAGFARTFYLHKLFSLPAPSLLVTVHGSLMTTWILLLGVQTTLISVRRVNWHRRLGIAGAALASIIVPLGCLTTLGAAQREARAHSEFVSGQLNVLGLELTQMALFAGLIGLALWYRNRPSIHKRLMIVATLCIIPNAIVRLSLLSPINMLHGNLGILFVWAFLVAGVVAMDSLRQRRISPAFGWSASVALVALYVAWYLSRTEMWDQYWIRVLG